MSRFFPFTSIAALAVALAFLALSCEGPAGPPGAGYGSLDDPSVMPAVVYTYPPMNSVGPYAEFSHYDCSYYGCSYSSIFQVRFNKFMEIATVRRAIHLSSSRGGISTDTGRVFSYGGDVVTVGSVDSGAQRYYFPFDIGETFTLTVDATAVDVNGNRMPSPFSATFVPEPWFRATGMDPADGATGIWGSNTISLAFNSPLDTSIRSHIRIEPEIDHSVSIETYYPVGRAYIYVSEPYATSTTYTVTVDSSARDAAGNRIHQAFSSSFSTRGFGITWVSPGDGYTGIPLNEPVTVSFTSDYDTASFRSAFSIDPPVPGTLHHSARTASFSPSPGWAELTTYTVTIDSTVKSTSGDRLEVPWRSSFTTWHFEVSVSINGYAPGGVSRHPYFLVYATGSLDTASIAGSVRLEPAVPLNIQTQGSLYTFFVVPAELLAPSTTYRFIVDTTLRASTGRHLSVPDTTTFITATLE